MTVRGDEQRFSGEVWVDLIAEADSGVSAGIVRFAPGARTAWHSHSLGQTLYVLDGAALVQIDGEAPVTVTAGSTHFTPAGVRHWHGALPDRFMTHIAIAALPEDGTAVDWQERVADEAYRSSVGHTARAARADA